MDTSNLEVNTLTSNLEVNENHIIIMTQEMLAVKAVLQEKNEYKNIIQQQSTEIGKLLSELDLWKEKYFQIYQQIV